MRGKMRYARLFAVLFLVAALIVIPAAATWSPPSDHTVIGVEWNSGDPSPTLRWIDTGGNTVTPPDFDDHVIWGNIKRVTVSDAGTVTRDINPRGDNLDLTGASGAVMTEIPKFYVKSEKSGNYYRWWISPDPATGFELHPAFRMRGGTERDYIYVGSYEATLRVLTDGTLALDSRAGEQPWTGYNGNPKDGMFAVGFTGGSSKPAVGATITGATSGTSGQLVDLHVASGSWGSSNAAGTFYLKQTSGTFQNAENLQVSGTTIAAAATGTANAGIVATINNFEAWGNNIGSGWGAMNVWSLSAIKMLYLVEHGTWASQETTGLGIVSKASGSGFAGEVTGFDGIDSKLDEYGTWGDTSAGTSSVSYRTMTDLWGNSWEWITGYTSTDTEYQITKRDGTGSLSTHPLAAGSYETSSAAPLTGASSYVTGYWSSAEYESLLKYQFIPSSVTGGNESTYSTDTYWSHYPGRSNVLLAGGGWNIGRSAGLGCLGSAMPSSESYRDGGARLEFVGLSTLAGGAPGAQYTQNATAGNAPLAVTFTDTSTGSPGWWRWDFGDGNISTEQHPTHTYAAPGTYEVTLTAYTIYGEDTYSATVEVLEPPAAEFTTNTSIGNAPLAVSFTDTSTGNVTAWAWTFGDDTTLIEQSPTHTYTEPGTYTVTLNASNAYGYSLTTATITAIDPPVAGFSANVTGGNAPLAVSFSDTSTGNVTAWAWTFGDGGTSTDQSPTHIYTESGTYTVTLNASNAYGSDTLTQTDMITVSTAPSASFSANTTSGDIPLAVKFTDTSTGDITGWQWNFGDDNISTDQHPEHTYTAAGLYTVTLTVSNAYSESTSVRERYITAISPDPPVASFTTNVTTGNAPLTVKFTDSSINAPTGWEWDFGDGGNSTAQHPEHTYASPGTYSVSLTASNAYGEGTVTQTNLITVLPPPSASFTADVTEGNAPLTVRFTDTSTGDVTGWSWDFGDGGSSTDRHPQHTYSAPGTYTVSLTVSNAYGEDTVTQTNLITVLPPPNAAFTTSVTEGLAPLVVQFTDTSTGDVTGWSWNFGDGGTSTDRHPQHTYTSPGAYTVSLTVSNAYGSDTETRSALITVVSPPSASFTASPTSGNAPLTVQFTDTSTGDVTGWSWNFGDGKTSTLRNPQHTYTSPGTYPVTLTVSNAYGSDTETGSALITVFSPPSASFTASPISGVVPLTVRFTDTSTGTVTGWFWNFGDGKTSTLRNPQHIYTSPGTYTVTLTVSNAYGSNTITQVHHITVLKTLPRFPETDKIETLAATGTGPSKVTLRGSLNDTASQEIWFEYGTKSNAYGFRTDPKPVDPGPFSEQIQKFPLIAGQTYYYRAACADGYGVEQSFTLPTLDPHPATTYGDAADQFINSFEDGDTMVQEMAEATWSPYVATLGALFFGLVIGAIFINLAMKGHSIAIPALLVMVIGGSLWALVPPEFIIIAQAFVIIGFGGLIYYIYTKRKM